MDTITLTDTGCYLDNHRGHYITRDAIELATGWGFIIGPFEEFVVNLYDKMNHYEDYPSEALTELCDEAVAWLNSGQINCRACHGTGNSAKDSGNSWKDQEGRWRCKTCTGTGRGDRIKGQNFPPVIPEGFTWAFEDGDFGLYQYDDDGNVID